MASDNETIAEISKKQREFAVQVFGANHAPSTEVWKLADRTEAAYKREIKGLIANLDALEKAVDRVCSRDEVAEIIAVKKEIQDDNQ